ncbi:MAG: MFS transporter [Clostridium sp.]|nr:MFS transporter [Clostridium sp.]
MSNKIFIKNNLNNKTPINKVNINSYTLVLILGFSGFVSADDNWFVSPAILAIASDFSISVSMDGSILTAYMLPYGVMQPVYGFFSDRFSQS